MTTSSRKWWNVSCASSVTTCTAPRSASPAGIPTGWSAPRPTPPTSACIVAQGKPVAITEFGCAGYRGADAVGARGLEIVEYDATGPVRLNGEYVRDEIGQAAYLRELLEAFDAGGIDSAFVFIFALYDMPYRPEGDPRDDLDLASYSIVKILENRMGDTYPDMRWEPKAAFTAVADFYRSH